MTNEQQVIFISEYQTTSSVGEVETEVVLLEDDIVIFADNIEDERRTIVSSFTIDLLERVARALSIPEVKITSTIRSLDKQIEAMYSNISRGKIIRYRVPGAAVTKVCQDGLKNNLSKSTIIQEMREKAMEFESMGERISLHVVSPEAYSNLNVIDITKYVSNSRQFINTLAEESAVTKILQPLYSDINNSIVIYSSGEDAIHVEIRQPE